MFMHCGLCIEEIKEIADREGTASPREYAQLEVGWTELGLQVWCKRHEVNVIHIDFEGQKHPANTSRERKDDNPQ
jgi:hypothetical protein